MKKYFEGIVTIDWMGVEGGGAFDGDVSSKEGREKALAAPPAAPLEDHISPDTDVHAAPDEGDTERCKSLRAPLRRRGGET